MNSALLKGSKEGSGTAGTAAVNMAADPECCFLRGGKAAALYFRYGIFEFRHWFSKTNIFDCQFISKSLLVEVSIHRSLGGITLQIFFMFPIWVTYPTRQQLTLKRDKGNFLPSFWKSVQETEEERNSP